MIVQCPNCQSKSRVDDAGAARGARVRCASCAHVFLPNTAIVSPKAAAAPAGSPAAGSAEEEFGGKTSLFTGVVARDMVGLDASAAPAPKPASQPSSAETTAGHGAPRGKAAAPAPVVADADQGFGGGSNRTQAIDVSQLAAYSAKISDTSAPAKPAPVAGLAHNVLKPKAKSPVASAAPQKLAAVLDAERQGDDNQQGTAVIGTREPGLLSAGVTLTSRVMGGLSLVAGVCGLIFFAAGNAVYATAGLMGGALIDMQQAQTPSACVEQVTSALYNLADGHEALVALGTIGNPGDVQGARLEVLYTLTDAEGRVVGQARGPVGAVLSLEELATITLPDSAAAELRRRVQNMPPMAPHSHDRKFMAVIKDPKHPVASLMQSVSFVDALAAEPAPPVTKQAANTPAPNPDDEAFADPELPQTAIPVPVQAVSAMPEVSSETDTSAQVKPATPATPAPGPKARKKSNAKAKRRR